MFLLDVIEIFYLLIYKTNFSQSEEERMLQANEKKVNLMTFDHMTYTKPCTVLHILLGV